MNKKLLLEWLWDAQKEIDKEAAQTENLTRVAYLSGKLRVVYDLRAFLLKKEAKT